MTSGLLKNLASLFLVQGLNYVVPLITIPLLVRMLGPAGYGQLGFALAFTQYFVLFTEYGFNLSATRQVALYRDDQNKVSHLFWNVMALKLSLAGCSALGLAIIAIVFFPSQQWSVLAGAFVMVIGSVLTPSWLFQGKEDMRWIAIANIIARLFALGALFLWVRNAADVWIAALISGLVPVGASVIGLWCVYRKRWIQWIRPAREPIRQLAVEGWHVFVSTLAVSFYASSTTILLGIFCGPVAVGYFVAADKLRQAVQGLIDPVSQAFFPHLSATLHANMSSGMMLLRRLFYWQGLLTLLLSVLLYLLSPYLIHWLYGIRYDRSIPVLELLAWLPFIVGLSNVLGIQTLLSLGFQNIFSRILLTGGVLNLLILTMCVTWWAERGAAMSILITEIVITAMMALAIHRQNIPLFRRSRLP